MQLTEITKSITTKNQKNLPSIGVTDLCCDSRLAKPGCIFFALNGTQESGSKYINDAIRKGAIAIVSESEFSPSKEPPLGKRGQGELSQMISSKSEISNRNLSDNVPFLIVANAREAMAKMAAQFYQNPSENFYLCGVTGTNGKTTITYLLEKIWGTQNSGVIGTINIRFQNKISNATHTTPESIQLQKIFADMAEAQCRQVVIEVSSHALMQNRVSDCDFDAAVFTNLTQDHLDYHQNMENYYQAKKLLFSKVLPESRKQNKLAVINVDDASGLRLTEELKSEKLKFKTFGIKNPKADLNVLEASFSLAGIEAKLNYLGQVKDFKSPLLGAHNLSNLLAALLVGDHCGLSFEHMVEKWQTMNVPGRLQRVSGKKSQNYFVDYAHTPDALENVLKALRQIMPPQSKQKLVVVFGCGGNRDRTKRPLMGEVAAKLADVVCITSDNPRTEEAQKIIEDILPGVAKHMSPYQDQKGYLVEVDRRKALEKITQITTSEDVVLVAGKGHEDYQIIGKQKFHFDDSEILAELLQ